ncbi:MAG: AMP-binding protein [Archangiaceae bacterium]|nr:AMP-binding protein [Archangiaceae bacterium]
MSPREGHRWGSTLLEPLLAALGDEPDRPLLIFEAGEASKRCSARTLLEGAAGFAQALTAHGVEHGECVVIAWPSSPELLSALFGCYLAGAVPVPAYYPALQHQLAAALERLEAITLKTRARVLLAPQTPVVEAFAQRMGVRRVDPQPPRPLDPAQARARVRPDDLALIQFTSGSTLAPRGAALTHRAMMANYADAIAASGSTPRDVTLSWMPLSHDFGLMAVLVNLLAGGTVVLQQPHEFVLDPLSWLRLIGLHRVTVAMLPNFGLALAERALRRRAAASVDLSSLRLLACGAEPVQPDTVRSFLATARGFGLDPAAFCSAYGLAENTVFVCCRPHGLAVDRVARLALEREGRATPGAVGPGSLEVPCLGRPRPGTRLRIVDDAGAVLGEREVGEVEVASGSRMQGYWEDGEATRAALHGEFVRTGDVGYLVDGELHLVARKKELIIVAGRKISPPDLERVVDQVANVRAGNAVAFGYADHGTEAVGLVVEAARDAAVPGMAAAIIAACEARLQVAPRVVAIVKGGSLHKTTSGKLQRALNRQALLGGELEPALLDYQGPRLGAAHV